MTYGEQPLTSIRPNNTPKAGRSVLPVGRQAATPPPLRPCTAGFEEPPAEFRPPRLLVSVRDADEARSALAGGCDILDVKEPNRGSLGMASRDALASIVDVVQTGNRRVLLSAALGEVVDWEDASPDERLPAGLDFVKLGLAGLGDDPGWCERWRSVRRRFHAGDDATLLWIAVAYADWQSANAPHPASVIAAAFEDSNDLRCAGVLFDTYTKNGRTLTDLLSPVELAAWARTIHAGGLMLALAGSLQQAMLPRLHAFSPDVIAIRTAACTGLDRSGAVDARAVDQFRAALTDAFRLEK